MPDSTKQSLSATEIPALFDASPYTTRFMLYRKFKHNEEVPVNDNVRMKSGRRFEAVLLDIAAEQMRLEVIPNKGPDGNQVYVRNGQIGCTRDAKVICPDRGPGALEVKMVHDYGVWMRDWGGGKTPPRHIEIQNQVQQFVGEGGESYKWGTIGAWCGGEMFYFERKPIPDLWEAMREEARRFFDDVAAGREPDAFGDPVEIPLLAKCYPLVAGKVLDLSHLTPVEDALGDPLPITDEEVKRRLALLEDARMLEYHRVEASGHEKALKHLKAKFLALALDADEIKLPEGGRVKIKQIARTGYTVKESTYKTVDVYVPENDGAI